MLCVPSALGALLLPLVHPVVPVAVEAAGAGVDRLEEVAVVPEDRRVREALAVGPSVLAAIGEMQN